MHRCNFTKGTHAGDLTKWTLIRGKVRKTAWICDKHAKAIDALWDALEPPQKPRKPLQVLRSLDDIPRA